MTNHRDANHSNATGAFTTSPTGSALVSMDALRGVQAELDELRKRARPAPPRTPDEAYARRLVAAQSRYMTVDATWLR